MAHTSSTISHDHLAYSHSPQVVNVQHWPSNKSIYATRTLVAGMLISGIVVAANYTVNLRNSLAVPIITDTADTKPIINQVEPSKSKPVSVVAEPKIPITKDLQNLLNKWQTDYKAGQYGVVIKELGGRKRNASLNAHTQFLTASLYKVFVSQYLYSKVESGQLSLSDYMGGYNVGNCLEQMIVVSSNACGHGLGVAIGWENLNTHVHSLGFKETTISETKYTSAGDMAKFLEKLQGGTLLGRTFNATLINYLKRQIYRNAIPAGVPGISVADKPGYYGYYWHDAAIVYHPKGAYILVVLSRGSGNYAIRDLSTRVSNYFNK